MSEERFIFKQVMEALFLVGLRERVTPAFRAELKAMGIDLNKLLPAYDYALWERAVIATAKLFPNLERGPALTESGRHMVQGTLENNPFGRAGLNLLRLMGVGKALKRAMGRSAAQNFNKTSFANETANSIEVHMTYVGKIPEFALGTVISVGEIMGAKNMRGRVLSYSEPSAVFLAEWD